MASLLIRQLDERLKQQLRLRAAAHGRSMEAEAREILRSGLAGDLSKPTPVNLAESIRRRVALLGGAELELPAREPIPEPPDFAG